MICGLSNATVWMNMDVWQRTVPAAGPMTPISSTPTSAVTPAAAVQPSQSDLAVLKETKNSLKELQEEFAVYRREKSENERWQCRVHTHKWFNSHGPGLASCNLFYIILTLLYLVEGLVWWDWPFTWWTDQLLSFSAWHCWLGHLTRKNHPRYDL